MHRLLLVGILCLILIGYYFFKMNKIKEEKPDPIIQPNIQDVTPKKEVKKIVKKKPLSVQKKKQNYLDIMVPALNEVYSKLDKQYKEVKQLIQIDQTSTIITNLKRKYKVQSNEELLIALKPHPKSIALAQGAMESAWGTSRFYKEAYNIFGVWSFNKNDKRIAAGSQRGDKTIWLKKYDSVKESLEDYYLTLSRSKAFKAFKRLNYETQHQNPYLLVKKLDRYSEKGALYGQELASMIEYNRFVRFDGASYAKPNETTIKKDVPVEVKKPIKGEMHTNVLAKNEANVDLEAVTDTLAESEDSFGDILKNIEQESAVIKDNAQEALDNTKQDRVNNDIEKNVETDVDAISKAILESEQDFKEE